MFYFYLSGIKPETTLGQIMQIRSETDVERLKKFTPDMHKIRLEWKEKVVNTPEYQAELAKKQENMFNTLKGIAMQK